LRRAIGAGMEAWKAKIHPLPRSGAEGSLQRRGGSGLSRCVDQAAILRRDQEWVREGAELGRDVIVRIGSRWIAALPDRIVELGHGEGAILLEPGRGPTGRTIELRIKPPSPQAPAALQV
jgi:hypothetical protein